MPTTPMNPEHVRLLVLLSYVCLLVVGVALACYLWPP
jgi:hypothetical protein